jgi:glycerophosphoryl diester phosphodiesterase
VPPAPTEPNPWLGRRVLSYAHQGGAWEAPSSTLFAIRRAVEVGASGIELDVHATSDGQLVVGHDDTVDRTTHGRGPIHTLTLAEVRELDNAYWWAPGADVSPGLDPGAYPYRGRAPEDHDFGIATLDEVLDLLDGHPEVAINLDIKATAPAVPAYEDRLASTLAGHGHLDRVIVASFLDIATERFRGYAPDVATSAGTLAVAEFWRALTQGGAAPTLEHVALQVPAVYGEQVLVDERFVEVAHDRGLAVHVWTINDEAEMARLLDLGVDGIISDRPTTLVELLGRRGADWRPGDKGSA